MQKMLLDSLDCELLLLLQQHGNIAKIQIATGIDKGHLSRKLTRLAEQAPVLTHVQGKWQLTPQGISIIDWYTKALQDQQRILSVKDELTFGTTQTISERKLAPLLRSLQNKLEIKKFNVFSQFENTEQALLEGKLDFAFVCAIPNSPEIRYKRVTKWPYVIVIPSSWKESFRCVDDLLKKPYVSHSGINMRLLLGLDFQIPAPVVKFDHIAGLRQGVISELGWSILPYYAVESEIESKQLRSLASSIKLTQAEEFQLWWLPGRVEKRTIQTLTQMLEKI